MSTAEQQPKRIGWPEYQAIERMNASTLVHGCKSMRALKQAMAKGFVETPAMTFGSQYHALLLEPEEFEATHAVMPNFAEHEANVTKSGAQSTSWSTEYCKQQVAAFNASAEQSGVSVITRKNYDTALAMIEAIHADERAAELMATCEREQTLTGEIEGVACKGRLDLLGGENGVIADVKGCQNAAPVAFGRTAANLRYAFKLAFYRELVRQNHGYEMDVEIIAVETGGELDCCVYEVPESALDEGLDKIRDVLRQYKDSLATDRWPGVNKGARTLPLYVPNWAMPEDDDDEVPYAGEDQ